jgi:hypothetical protein
MEAGIYTKALSYPRILWLDNFSRGTTFADVASTWSSSSSTAAVTTTTAPAPTVSASPAPNPGLAPNPGFELDPAASYYSSGTAAFSWASDAAHSAAHSLKIASADSGLSRWGNQPALLPVTAGASYDIGAFFKLASVTSQARLGVSFYGANGFLSAAAGPEALSGTSDWRQTSMSVVVPAAATSMRVEFRLYGTGTLWADDVSVAPTTTPTVTAPVATSAPTISGKATQDELLSATTGAWSGSPTSYSYQWRRCDVLGGACTDLAGATAATYKLAAADVGLTLRVHVLATNSAGTTSADSAQTPVVTAPLTAPLSTSPPSISGSTMVGKTLTASAGNWSGSPSKYAYQWQRCNATGAACAAIANATAATYAPTGADAGTTLRVAVTATNPGGSTTATSSATRTIKGR